MYKTLLGDTDHSKLPDPLYFQNQKSTMNTFHTAQIKAAFGLSRTILAILGHYSVFN